MVLDFRAIGRTMMSDMRQRRRADDVPPMTPQEMRRLRRLLGVNQYGLAQLLGVSRSAIARDESGAGAPGGVALEALHTTREMIDKRAAAELRGVESGVKTALKAGLVVGGLYLLVKLLSSSEKE